MVCVGFFEFNSCPCLLGDFNLAEVRIHRWSSVHNHHAHTNVFAISSFPVANIYFLGLVVLQVFPMFGASTPQIAMLPLVAVLVMTGIKDGLEDWRRARLDDEVNNSAATKLGSWKNVNQPTDPRTFMERLFRMGNGMFRITKIAPIFEL